MTFIVGGYDNPETAYGSVFLFSIPSTPDPDPRNPERSFGMTWGGQLEIASRIIHGFDPVLPDLLRATLNLDDAQVQTLTETLRQHTEYRIPYAVLPLQDCVDLATFLIRATMSAQALAATQRGVGGPIEVATVTRMDGVRFVQRKLIHGETPAKLGGADVAV